MLKPFHSRHFVKCSDGSVHIIELDGYMIVAASLAQSEASLSFIRDAMDADAEYLNTIHLSADAERVSWFNAGVNIPKWIYTNSI